jgi:protein tyrosine/serine phosphatase
MIKNVFRAGFTSLVIILSFAGMICAQTEPRKDFPNVTIKNFGKMDDNFYRGAQPDKDEYKELAAIGVKTVIDLRDDPKTYEKTTVEALGMKYINIPMQEYKYPSPESIDAILKVMNDPSTGIFYVHCAGGRHRTGVAGALYRYTKYGWDYDRVYREMKNYDFYTRFGHGVMRDFVVDFAEKMKMAKTPGSTSDPIVPQRK